MSLLHAILVILHLTTPTPRPLTIGLNIVQCQGTRSVVCLEDEGLNDADCRRTVVPAIAAINEAAGRELLRFDGAVDEVAAVHAFRSGAIVVYVEELPENTLGRTRLQAAGDCIGMTTVAISPTVFQEVGVYNEKQVVLHELIHAIGFDHATGIIPSVMAPSVASDNSSPTLTEGDRLSIRTAYGY